MTEKTTPPDELGVASCSPFPWEPIPEWMFEESVEARNALQNCGRVHPYTCGNNDCRKTTNQAPLRAVENGWVCDHCGYTQSNAANDQAPALEAGELTDGDSRRLPASACSGLVGFTDGIHGRYILGVPNNPTGIPCMNREHAEAILQRTLHHSKIRVSSKNDTMEFCRNPQVWSSETYRLEDWFDEQEENLGPVPELNPTLNLNPPIKSLDELN